MWHGKKATFWLLATLAVASLAVACSSGVPTKDYDAAKADAAAKAADLVKAQADLTKAQSDVAAIQKQLASVAPVNVVQAGQLQPVSATTKPTGWDTAESIRGGLQLYAQYDSSGPDAWDAKAHPLVFVTSANNPDPVKSGVQIIDAYSKQTVASAFFDLGKTVKSTPHSAGVSPDGKWFYIALGQDNDAGTGQWGMVLVINARTLKIDKVLKQESYYQGVLRSQRLHHVQGFKDSKGNDRVVLQFGFGSSGGPDFILDPKNDNKVVRAINYDDVSPQGHPFTTPSPDGKYIYISMDSPMITKEESPAAAIAKLNLEDGSVVVIPGVGNHPIGITHTADGKFTYVVDAENSRVYKIDDATNTVIKYVSAGVAGPYGIALNWDESLAFVVGKGEGSHNTGDVLGVIDLKTFAPARTVNGKAITQPITLSNGPGWPANGHIASVDHAVLHPDPKVNELWIGDMGGNQTSIVDLNTLTVKAYVPTPTGGNEHAGGFVQYKADWTGELQSDMGGPKSKAMLDNVKAAVAATAAKK